MGGDSIGRLIYVVLLLVIVGGWFFAQNRQKLNKNLQQAILWGFLFAGAVLLYGVKDDLRQQISPRAAVQTENGQIILRRASDLHFYASLKINGQDIEFIVDTGASDMVLSRQDAIKVGLDPAKLVYFGSAQTANGAVKTARVKLDSVTFGGVTDTSVTAFVNDGEMFGSLLGMSYLSRFSRLEIAGDRLILTR
ncbi:MAG: TIGR02281 family clan AA aspartic protease [Alphaproteobacteria bacterium]|nr:TIGR02281 family clan AA aspartic protease [Alphaproteobacteria bacterium]